MSETNVRSEGVDVEQIMRQIRARIREKRGVDYTEAEVEQLATVKLEQFLDPRGVRSDLVEQYRRQRVVSPSPPNYEFGETTLYETHRGPLQFVRRLLRPVLKLFINPDRITSALHIQSAVNDQAEARIRQLEEREPLNYEIVHNLTLEVTRLGIEAHNLRMRVESLSSRLDFDERRARALESVVEYRPDALERPGSSGRGGDDRAGEPGEGGDGERRRRRRRRRRRPGRTQAEAGATGDDDRGEGDAAPNAADTQGADEAGPARSAEPSTPAPDAPPPSPEADTDPTKQ